MQKWEYTSMTMDGKPKKKEMKKLNLLGQDGWEIIANTPLNITNQMRQRLHYIKSKSGPKTLMTDTINNKYRLWFNAFWNLLKISPCLRRNS